jgi:serine/threonine protein kinase
MGEVWKARDTRLGRIVAIKVLPAHLSANPEVRARFEREARAISQLSHPHICALYDIGQQDNIDYLVMEYLEGETLAARLAKGSLPTSEVLRYGIEIANALDCAHRSGIVHRDLKPGNIMLTKGGAKLMDFGLARAVALSPAAGTLSESPTASSPLTAKGTIVGTFQYMAPEQLEAKETDARTDLWALGCVLYEMATGKRAFEGTSQASLIAAIMEHEPQPISELQPLTPPALERITKRCLEKDPDERFQSARDLSFNLEWMQGASTTSAGAATSLSLKPRRKSVFAFALLLIAVAALAAGIAYLSVKRSEREIGASRIAYTRLTVERGRVFSARFSPDGKTVFYSAAWNGQPVEVFEARPGFPSSRALGLPGTDLLSISSNGTMAVTIGHTSYVAFSQTWGTLAEVPISGGAPHRLLDEVLSGDWSSDGKMLAISHSVGGKARIEMPPGHVLFESSGWLSYVRVAPSGKWLAFVDNPIPPDNRGNVIITDASGRVLARTGEWQGVSGIAWSRDGSEAWYAASLTGEATDIRALRPGGGERVVARFPGYAALYDIGRDGQLLLASEHHHHNIYGRSTPTDQERQLGWLDVSTAVDISPDGRTLLIDEESIAGGPLYAVFLRGMDGSTPVRLGEGQGSSLASDGKWALAIHFGPPQRLLMMPTGTGDSKVLPGGRIERYLVARWLPDATGVVFVGSEAGHAWRTYVQDIKGGLPRPITPEDVTGTFVSPDGRFLAAHSAEQQLYAYPMGGGKPRLIAQLLPEEVVFQWALDGRSIYVGSRGTGMSIDRIERDTGRRTPWRTFRVPDPAGVSLVWAALTPDGRSYAYTSCCVLDDLYLVSGLK